MRRGSVMRVVLVLVALGGFVASAFIVRSGHPLPVPLLVWSGLVLVALAVERWRYWPRHDARGAWQPTGERFIDPQSGQPMEVLYNPATGERRYEATHSADGRPKA